MGIPRLCYVRTVQQAIIRVRMSRILKDQAMKYSELSTLYAHLLRHPDMTQEDTAKRLNWRDGKGRPYRVKVQRALITLEKLGCIKVDKVAEIGRHHFSRKSYACILPPQQNESVVVLETDAKADGSVYVRGKVISSIDDALAHISYVAQICRNLANNKTGPIERAEA